MKSFCIFLIQLYQAAFGLIWSLFGQSCRCIFVPSCSEYTKICIENHGAGRGVLLGFKRIAKCHPFSKGGIDLPV